MTTVGTERAIKKAYFTDTLGGNLLEFQFSPASLDFEEAGRYSTRNPIGSFFTDMVWISGRPSQFNLRMFIDRTQESYVADTFNQDPFANVKRLPNINPAYSSLDIVNLINGINGSAFFKGRKRNVEGNDITPSNYSASPHYSQSNTREDIGVMNDVEALMYYVRPKGLKLSEIIIDNTGIVNTVDFKEGRFTSPPKCRFYYGNMWREGYIVQVRYNLSAVNKSLVPRRMDATLRFSCTRWGHLNDIGDIGNFGSSLDIFDVNPNDSEISNLA